MKNQILNFIILGILFILSFGFNKVATAATRTVSSSSELQSAINSSQSGDIIQVRGGNYGGFSLSGSGKTIKNYPGETPTVEGTVNLSGSNNVVEGFVIRNGGGLGCVELSGTRNTVRNNDIYSCTQGGIVMWDAHSGYFLIEGNKIHEWKGIGNWDGIEAHGTPYVIVKNNIIYNPGPEGDGADFIDAGSQTGSTIEDYTHHMVYDGNTVYCTGSCPSNPYENRVKIDKAPTFSILRRNTIYGAGFTFYVKPFVNDALYSNSVINCRNQCILFWQWGDGPSGWGGFAVKNNIFAFSTNYLMQHSRDPADGAYPSIRMEHNVYRPSSQGIIWALLNGETNYGTSLAEFNRWRSATGQEPNGGKFSTQTLNQLFVNPSTTDFRLAAGSDAIDAGVALTTTRSGGSGTIVPVQESFYFYNGYGMTDPDTIQIGSNIVKVVSIDESGNNITVDRSISWTAGVGVSLPYNGAAPDAGAVEYGSGGSTGPAPTPSPIPSPNPTPSGTLKGDLNNDKIVNSLDWSIMNSRWYTNDTTADLNSDGIINSLDFSIMNGNWLKNG